ncbi:hypothetical protein ACO1PF_07355 [Alkalibacterium sp. f15]|uniref:hypothetical protein n=1 Tax=Alkalibacterium sp. f15 TaxID=3414029 RepID=UPI003BF807DD
MKKRIIMLAFAQLLTISLLAGCNETDDSQNDESEDALSSEETDTNDENDTEQSYAGTFVGRYWSGETDGVPYEEADQYIETILELDEDGIIVDAKMNFFKTVDDFWTMRQSGNAYVDINYDIEPTTAVPGEDYEAGDSMFTVYTADMMSFYAVGVNEDNTVAHAIVDPITRYQFESKLPADFDYETLMSELTVNSEYNKPTTRTSGSGPNEWDSLKLRTIFNTEDPWSHVVNSTGVLEGVDNDSTVKDYMEALGVEFDGETPQPMEAVYSYFGKGGWNGNYRAIEENLIGQNATELTSLIDWSDYEESINDENQFGVDVETGATKTVQNSVDTISGATVRMSREATSYQRALIDAGILDEDDIILGRF